MAQKLKAAGRVAPPAASTDRSDLTTRRRLKPGDHVVYTGPRVDIGGVNTGAKGVVERIADSVDMARVHWDTFEVHAQTYKELRLLTLTGPGSAGRNHRPAPQP